MTARRGIKRAVTGGVHATLIIACAMLMTGGSCREFGVEDLERINRDQLQRDAGDDDKNLGLR